MSNDNVSKQTGALSPEKLALLVLRRKKSSAEAVAMKIPRRAASGPAPLSFSQQRLWLLDRIEPGSTAYNMPMHSRLRGALDVSALESALSEIVRRHESLRTTFIENDGEPAQVISPPLPARLPVADLSVLPGEVRHAEASRLASEDKRPWNLERGPLFRFALVRLSEEEHLLFLDMHHIISDGWSFGVFFRELGALYGTTKEGRPSSLPELPIQFADFAVWQREWLQGSVLEERLAYWRQRLAGSPPALELPTDRVRPAVQSHRGESAHIDVPPTLTARLRELSRREETSLFMTLLAVFQLLLARLSGQEDIVVGSPSAGRNRVEMEGLIGLFLNTLVLRTDLSGDPTFRELLSRAKETVLGAYRYQDLPFERLLEELQPERLLSRTPIFQVLFNLVPVSEMKMELSGLAIEHVKPGASDAKFDFTLYVGELPDTIRFNLVYSADLFDRERIEEMLRQLERLLEHVTADPERRIGSLSLVSGAAAAILPDPTQPLSGEWMGAAHHALSRGAAELPDQVAVRDERGEVWTYASLEARANRLARFLIARGVEKGDVVAVWAHRGASLVQGLLGTLKAGAAFLILDPAYPVPRLLEYLRIGRPAAWIGIPGSPPPSPEIVEATASFCRCRIDLPLLTDAAASPLAGFPESDPGLPVGPDDIACVTFTSGSTGVPKGVAGRHGSLTHFYPWMGKRFGLGRGDRFGMLSALAHDPLQRDALTPLWFGAQLAVPDPDSMGEPGYLAAWARRERITVLNLTPAMMELLLDSAENGNEPVRELPDLRLVFVVGDLLKKSEVERLQRLAPSLTCVNLYGSTETQRAISFFVVPRPDQPEALRLGKEVLPLGHGMEGAQLLVLGRNGIQAGVGELGEICIRSHHLARGYLADEALTAERFLPNPFLSTPDGRDRIYKTGDLGRYLPDGAVEFAGRADFQVKLRGFRIELGEVEAAMARFPGIRECVAVVREDRPGHRRLVAYLAGVGDTPDPRELRAFLSSRLPDYMVPSAFVHLPALPLTRTGKVDRRSLPAPEEPAPGRGATAPRNPVEEILATVWAEVLHRKQVGIHDNFFELGGDSIRTIQVVARCHKHSLRVAPRQIFQHQTIAELAEVVEVERLETGPAPGTSLPLTPGQRLLAAGLQDERETVRVYLPSGIGVETVERALRELADRHDALRLRFERGPEGWSQRLAPEGEPCIPLEPVARLEGGSQALRAALPSEGSGAGHLLLAAHPLALDTPSWNVLLADLVVLCEGISLPAAPVPFARWAEVLASLKGTGSPPLRVAAPEPVTIWLGERETSSLLDEALAAYGNLVEEVLLAALTGAFAPSCPIVEVEGLRLEREGLDASRTVGLLAIPVQVRIQSLPGLGDTLKDVKERLRKALRQELGTTGEPDVVLRWTGSLPIPAPWRAERLTSSPEAGGHLRISCRLEDGRLRADWTSAGMHRRQDLEKVAGRFLESLNALVRHCASPQAGGFTPSDFPVSGLDQADLDELLAELA